MERDLAKGSRGSRFAAADKMRADPHRRQRRLFAYLAWRSLGVRFALSRAKRRAHGRKSGPLKSIAAL